MATPAVQWLWQVGGRGLGRACVFAGCGGREGEYGSWGGGGCSCVATPALQWLWQAGVHGAMLITKHVELQWHALMSHFGMLS